MIYNTMEIGSNATCFESLSNEHGVDRDVESDSYFNTTILPIKMRELGYGLVGRALSL